MLGKLQENERDLFRTRLEDLINPTSVRRKKTDKKNAN